MSRRRQRRISTGVVLTLIGVLVIFCVQAVASVPPAVAKTGDLLPNLKMIPLHDWHLEYVNGRRLLRFTTIMVNKGPGAFETRGVRSSTSDRRMHIRQVIYNSSGDRRAVRTKAVGRYAGDGHDHWHVQQIMTYELFAASDLTHVRRGAKTGFCFFDTTPWRLGLPNARQAGYYQEEWCGTQASLRNRVGISVGWGDRYPWYFAYQWIDVTDLPGGRYVVRATVDIQNWYRETNNFDGCRWTKIRIPEAGHGNSVRIIDEGVGCGDAAMTQVDSFPGARTFSPERHLVIKAGTRRAHAFNAVGTAIDYKVATTTEATEVTALRRAKIPGRPGRWYYLTTGPWAGYWLRDTAAVSVIP